MEIIRKKLTLEYWPVNEWFEGRILEVPQILSQGKTLDELDDHIREDVAHWLEDPEWAKANGVAHLEPPDIFDAELQVRKLDRFGAAVAQLFVLSKERREKVFQYIEDLVDLEALERRADEEDARRAQEEGGEDEEEW